MPSSQAEANFILFSNLQQEKSHFYIIKNFPKPEIRTLKITVKETKKLKQFLEWVEIQGRKSKKN